MPKTLWVVLAVVLIFELGLFAVAVLWVKRHGTPLDRSRQDHRIVVAQHYSA